MVVPGRPRKRQSPPPCPDGDHVIRSPLPFRCLVVCPLPIVAEDLAEIIRESFGPAAAETCIDPARAVERIDGWAQRPVVFAAIRTQAVAELGLDRAVAARAGRLVLVGSSLDPTEAEARGWLLLAEPFSNEMVEEVLHRLNAPQ